MKPGNTGELIKASKGEIPADLLLTDARIVNVYTGQVVSGNIAVYGGSIVGIGDYPAKSTVSLHKRFAAPGFIDAHVHIESTMASVSEFVRGVLPCGTTTVVADPHEIANVLGMDGVAYMLATAENQPMNIYFMLPSCVPATPMETAGAVLDAGSLMPLLSHERILGLGEMMNFPGVLGGDGDVVKKIESTFSHGKVVDGHAPGLTGKDIAAYLAAGISSDHETVAAGEALEKLAAGMFIMIREGTGAKNLLDLVPVITPYTEPFLMWCSDDRHPEDIRSQGHIDFLVRKAVGAGVDPMRAIRMATINPARYFGLSRLGGIAPGKTADIIVLSDMETLRVERVYSAGRLVAEQGRMHPDIRAPAPVSCPSSMRVDITGLDFFIPADGKKAKVIELVPAQLVTKSTVMEVRRKNGAAISDPSRDMLKLVVVERHKGTGRVGKGFVTGFGLEKGALASSVAHDSHNIVAVGVDDADIMAAVGAVVEMEGGLVVASDGGIDSFLALPIAGLMADADFDAIRQKTGDLDNAARKLGCRIRDPFMSLSFLALPVIPELRLTDLGLFDVQAFAHVPLMVA